MFSKVYILPDCNEILSFQAWAPDQPCIKIGVKWNQANEFVQLFSDLSWRPKHWSNVSKLLWSAKLQQEKWQKIRLRYYVSSINANKFVELSRMFQVVIVIL